MLVLFRAIRLFNMHFSLLWIKCQPGFVLKAAGFRKKKLTVSKGNEI